MRHYLIILFIALVYSLWIFSPGFDETTVSDDLIYVGYHVLHTTQGLFGDDIARFAYYQIAPGYVIFVSGMTLLMGLVTYSKIFSFVFLMYSVLMCFLIGRERSVKLGYVFAVVFMLYAGSMNFFSGALPRAFQYPLILTFIFLFLRKRFYALYGLIILSAFFYPPVNTILIGAMVLYFLHRRPGFWEGVILTVSVLISLGGILMFIPDVETVSYEEARQMHEFSEPATVLYYFGYAPLEYGRMLVDHDYDGMIYSGPFEFQKQFPLYVSVVLLLSLAVFSLSRNAWSVPPIFYYVLGSSVLLYVLSLAVNRFFFLDLLLFPVYYTKAVLPLFIAFVFAWNLRFLHTRALVAVFLVALVPYIAAFEYDFDTAPMQPEDYDRLSELPGPIAGHPLFLRYVPLFSKTEVYANLCIPATEYHVRMKERIRDFLGAIYGSRADVSAYCGSATVSHIVLDQEFVSTAPGEYDLNQELADKFAISYGGDRGSFLTGMRQEGYGVAIISCEDLSVEYS
ncbi:MAG: hypothetical protein ACQESG_00155 [Nanobdellota archaeon]